MAGGSCFYLVSSIIGLFIGLIKLIDRKLLLKSLDIYYRKIRSVFLDAQLLTKIFKRYFFKVNLSQYQIVGIWYIIISFCNVDGAIPNRFYFILLDIASV